CAREGNPGNFDYW
nr:immunoglobulin heavy chain junction region [Mus musculus]